MKGDFKRGALQCENLTSAPSDITNFDCWMATLPLPNLDSRGLRTRGSKTPYEVLELAQSFKDMRLDLNCIECSSPQSS